VPLSSQPSAVRRAGSLRGKMTAGARKEPSAPKISSCACSGNQEPTCSAWLAMRHMHQPADMSPRAISIQICAYVAMSVSMPP
jgi:hypothetical protein